MSELVDTHVHVISGERSRYPRRAALSAPWTRADFELAALESEMKGAGVGSAVIVQTLGLYEFDNTYVAEAVASGGNDVAGVVAVDPADPAAPNLVRRLVHGRIRGVRLPAGPVGRGFDAGWLRDARADALWRAAGSAGASIVMWCDAGALPDVAAVMRRYPEVVVALDHCGGAAVRGNDAPELAPFTELAVRVKVTTAQLAAPGVDPAALVRNLVSRFDASRVMWGTNYPASNGTYRAMAELGRRSAGALSALDQDLFLFATARALYF